MAELIDGKVISQQIKDETRDAVAELAAKGITVTLAVILVGADPASAIYVRNKKRACEYTGIRSISIEMPEETTQEELLAQIEMLNQDDSVDGILVQLPLPVQISEEAVIAAIDPSKDVDGFHVQSVGALCVGREGFVSCTPAGIIQLLKRSDVVIEGSECVVVGRSNIVGKPVSMLLLSENGTVTTCHSRTKNLKEVCRRADILVCAIGKPRFFTREYVKEGAVVIDVGIHRNEDNKLCGDVDFADVEPVAAKITPVPGGVGPMTIAMLMSNCVKSAKMRHKMTD